jgi:DNA-binding response OmpR family regulator
MKSANSLPRVLIVDDVRTNVQILMAALRHEYRLGVVTSGAAALEYARQHCPDLILLDIMMPEMDGYEVCSRLKADERTRGIPLIFITALDETQEKTRGFSLGAVDYITKPFDVAEVKARVQTHLKIEQYQRELEARNRALEEARTRLQFQLRELEGRDRLVRFHMSVASVQEAAEEILKVAAQVLRPAQAALFWPGAGEKSLDALAGAPPARQVPLDDPASSIARACQNSSLESAGDEAAAPLLHGRKLPGVLWIKGLNDLEVDRETGLEALWRLAGEAALVLHAAQLTQDLASSSLDVKDLIALEENGAS